MGSHASFIYLYNFLKHMEIDNIRSFCLRQGGATEEVKWDNDLVFSVGGKMFCVASLEPPFRCSFKVPDEVFEEMSVRPGFMPAPYLARARWVSLTEPARLSKGEWEQCIARSYSLVKEKLTKKLRAELGI